MLCLRIHLALLCALVWMPSIGASVVITEIMYHPDTVLENEEFIEILNTGPATQSLDGWRFSNGIDFSFPSGEELEPGERLVICLDTAAFDAVHPGVHRVGNWTGHLSNSGERVTLTNDLGGTADTVAYDDSGSWSVRADGDGQSLECIVPTLDNDTPRNWRASAWQTPGTPGAPNTVEFSLLPPLLTSPLAFPAAPGPGESVTVMVHVEGEVSQVNLVVGESEIHPMHDDGLGGDLVAGDGFWTGEIPGVAAGERIRWFVEAHGVNGAIDRLPEYAPIERLGHFIPGPDEPEDLPVWHLWIAESDLAEIHADPTSDDLHCAALSVGDRYIEPVLVRLRGGERTREFPKPSWKIYLPEWQEIDEQQTFNLHSGYTDLTMMREIVTHRLFERAGHPASHAEPVRLVINGEYQGLHTLVENIGRRWLRARDLDPDRDLFHARRGLFQDSRVVAIEANWEREIDATGMEGTLALSHTIEVINDTSLSPEDWASAIAGEFELDSMINHLAIRACTQSFDDKNKNLYLYRLATIEGDRWLIIPFDLDLSLGRMWLPVEPDGLLNDILVTDLPALWAGFPPNDFNPLWDRIEQTPALRDQVQRRIGELLATHFRLALLGPEIGALHSQILAAALEDPLHRATDEDILGGAEELREFFRLRRVALATEIPPERLVINPERLRDHLLGIEPLVGNEVSAGDLNGDGDVDVADMIQAAGDR
ncbi:CotH kinase family protein [Candidatus Sumerlaeota bacterium]|nr:CotH kinase family protein [Candidatus Sumerlaeota bacterium]